MGYAVAVVGATGAVGREIFKVLEQRSFPVDRLVPLASARSKGTRLRWAGQDIEVQELTEQSFHGVQIALFSAGGSVSQRFAPAAAQVGAWVVDNTSAFRMDPEIALVVPEVNPGALDDEALLRRRIIANPNCSTIQMLVALNPLRSEAGIHRIVVSTYQAVGGAGQRAMKELDAQATAHVKQEPLPAPQVFPHPILFECLPQIGSFLPSGYSVEEQKMIDETRKIFAEPGLRITATTVRVPVMVGHGESINVETQRPITVARARDLLRKAPGVELMDRPKDGQYPLARQSAGTDPVYVGRLREDPSVEHGLNMWVVADNLRKGAALNAVQIAEILVEKGRI